MQNKFLNILFCLLLTTPQALLSQEEMIMESSCIWEVQIGSEFGFKDFSSFSTLFSPEFESGYSFDSELMYGTNIAVSLKFKDFIATAIFSNFFLEKEEGVLLANFQDQIGSFQLGYEWAFGRLNVTPLVGLSQNYSRSTFSSTDFPQNPGYSGLPTSYLVSWNTWQADVGIYLGTTFVLPDNFGNRKVNLGFKYVYRQHVFGESPENSNGNKISGLNELNTNFMSAGFVLGIPIN